MKTLFSCFSRLFLSFLILFQFVCKAEFTDEESESFIQKGIIPFIDQLQDGDYSQGIYLVPHDLTVDTGKVMTVFPGSTILFKKDSEIIVKGKLVLKGTADKRIILRKLDNDMYMNPFSSDIETLWDGIKIEEGGELEASYTHVCDSKYGFNVSRNASIFLLDSVLFSNNKYQNVTVGSEVIAIENDKLSFYKLQKEDVNQVRRIIIDTIKTSTYVQNEQPFQAIQGKPKISEHELKLRVAMGAIAVGGMILGGASYYVNKTYYKKYDQMRNPGKDDPDRVARYENYSKIGTAGLISGSALTFIGISCMTLVIVF